MMMFLLEVTTFHVEHLSSWGVVYSPCLIRRLAGWFTMSRKFSIYFQEKKKPPKGL
jgi:hypothetical protein